MPTTPIDDEVLLLVTLPWMLGRPEDPLRVSVFVSPRLRGTTASRWTLGDPSQVDCSIPHCRFLCWSRLAEKLTFHLERRGLPRESLTLRGKLDHALWEQLFHSRSPVNSFRDETLSTVAAADEDHPTVTSYSPTAAAKAVRSFYGRSGVTADVDTAMLVAMTQSDDDPFRDLVRFHFGADLNSPMSVTEKKTIVRKPVVLTAADDGETIAAEVTETDTEIIVPCFVLPRVSVAPRFSVTIRAPQDYAIDVESEPGEPFNATESRMFEIPTDTETLFERTPNGWSAVHRLDVHEVVSALTAYPEVMKRIGLVLEFEAPALKVSDLLDASEMRVTASGASCHVPSTFVFPWSAYRKETFGSKALVSAEQRSDTWTYGFLKKKEDHDFVELDVDGAVLKLLGAAADRVEVQSGKAVPAPVPPKKLPALRQAGISLVDERTDQEIQDAIELARKREEQLAAALAGGPPPTLYAEDLVQGYRIDVRRRPDEDKNKDKSKDEPGPWRSLCERFGTYFVAGATYLENIPDEGFIETVSDTRSTGDGHRVSRALFRWDGWSLAVPRPAKGIRPSGAVAETPPPRPGSNFPLTVRFAPPGKRLERLRIGQRYEFRARAVDLAGNSLTLADCEGLSEMPADTSFLYGEEFARCEPVDAPQLLPLQPVASGETNDHLVIRDGDREVLPIWSAWMIMPPRVSEALAELHGVFDGMKAENAWNLIVSREESLPGDLDARGYDAAWIKEHVRHGSAEVTYLPDPLSRGAAVCADAWKKRVSMPFVKRTDADPLRPHEPQPFRLVLSHGKCDLSLRHDHVLVSLPPGRMLRVDLSSMLFPGDANSFATWRWLVAQNPSLENDAIESMCEGAIEQLTPHRPLTLVHAVRRPLIPAGHEKIEFTMLDPQTRTLGSTEVDLNATLAIDLPSTSKVTLRASWDDPVDDPQFPDFTSSHFDAEAFQKTVPPPADLLSCPDPLPNFDASGRQKFEDTKHRFVNYEAVALSRFVEYYAESEADQRFTRRSRIKEAVIIKSTRRPDPCSVYYVLPTFGYEKADAKREISVRRSGGALRVYMHRGWFSSGRDEKLAVVLPPRTKPFQDLVRDRVSDWGADPLWRAGRIAEPLGLDHFRIPGAGPVAASPPPPTVEDLLTTVTVEEKDQTGATKSVTYDVHVGVAIYDVHVDAEKNLLYADIGVNTSDSYFPFVRLALARYQKEAEARTHLSDIVRVAYVQTAPDRAVTVVRKPGNRYLVRLGGPTYEANSEAKNTSRLPATVEVSVERKVDGLGRSQLDWFPILEMPATVLQRSGDAWEGEVALPQTPRYHHRIVVREYENFLADGPEDADGPDDNDAVPTRRLVYAYPVRLEEL